MPSGRRTRERQLAKLAARRAGERRRRRRQRIVAIALGLFLVIALVGGLGVVFLRDGEEKATPSAKRSATPTPSPSPSPKASPGSNCGYTRKKEASGPKGSVEPPKFTIDVAKTFVATVSTSEGTFKIKLLPKEAPCTVNNFVYLARKKFFDGLMFHRIVKDFVIQGGDPEGTGRGGPGYSFNDELGNSLTYQIGAVAMANSGPNTNGSQFFVVAGQQGTTLPKSYTIFGEVTQGLDVVTKINRVPTKGGSGPDQDSPRQKVIIERITIKES
jgi:cyclophilin family peptidyl-prolyl cis-trans isomerase